MNRFSKDLQQMDEELPNNLQSLIELALVFAAGDRNVLNCPRNPGDPVPCLVARVRHCPNQ